MSKFIYKYGVDDSDYQIRRSENGKIVWTCPYYQRWVNMLARCYSSNQLKYTPSYNSCSVCNDWLVFSSFKHWMTSQEWWDKELDKDLFGDGLEYKPLYCCFISKHMNLLISSYTRGKGYGYMEQKKKWRAYYTHPLTRRHKHIGLFDIKHDACVAAKIEKDKAYKEVVLYKTKDTSTVKERFLRKFEIS